MALIKIDGSGLASPPLARAVSIAPNSAITLAMFAQLVNSYNGTSGLIQLVDARRSELTSTEAWLRLLVEARGAAFVDLDNMIVRLEDFNLAVIRAVDGVAGLRAVAFMSALRAALEPVVWCDGAEGALSYTATVKITRRVAMTLGADGLLNRHAVLPLLNGGLRRGRSISNDSVMDAVECAVVNAGIPADGESGVWQIHSVVASPARDRCRVENIAQLSANFSAVLAAVERTYAAHYPSAFDRPDEYKSREGRTLHEMIADLIEEMVEEKKQHAESNDESSESA